MQKWIILFAALSVLTDACSSEGGTAARRPLGAACGYKEQCVDGVCGGGACLDPALDSDTDGLINIIEAGLGTNPVLADSDGDGTDDRVEVGALDSPVDTDGDGKLDAIESMLEDTDSDCIVDQADPIDWVSDVSSAPFPDACGTGEVFCGYNPVRYTCAEPLGVMIYSCFMPIGACEIGSFSLQSVSISWENGARIEADATGGQVSYFGPGGTLCGTATSTAEGSSTITVVGGKQFRIKEDEKTGVTTVTCPDDNVIVQLDAGLQGSFDACSGGGEEECSGGGSGTDTPGVCTTDTDCDGGTCCTFGGAGGFCLPEGQTCP